MVTALSGKPATSRPKARAATALAHPSLAASAADWIADRILQGGISPGEKLTETGLADLMGISRSPVREALRELSRGGLITIEPRRGAFVAELDAGHAAELYVCRLMLEPTCVGLSVGAMDARTAPRTRRQVRADEADRRGP